tara:strand:- start:1665 stop:1856 length:192 start_codon:yes stop_codon:yes gene_type:complete
MINFESNVEPSSMITISKVLGVFKAPKLSRSSLISSGRLKTGIINEKSLAIIYTKLIKEIELK